jgi:hypothetical protein
MYKLIGNFTIILKVDENNHILTPKPTIWLISGGPGSNKGKYFSNYQKELFNSLYEISNSNIFLVMIFCNFKRTETGLTLN